MKLMNARGLQTKDLERVYVTKRGTGEFEARARIHTFGASRILIELRWPNTVFKYTGVSKHYLKTTYF